MSTHDPSPRPVETLPPTLLPNPVFLSAPRPDRVKSLLVASTIYFALGAALVGGARHAVLRPVPKPTVGAIWQLNPDPEMPERPEPRPAPPSSDQNRPVGAVTVERTEDRNVIPEDVSDLKNLKDHSLEFGKAPDNPDGLTGIIGVPKETTRPVDVVAPRPQGPVDVDVRMIRILHQVSPVYPALARLAKKQGPVELRMTIDTRGVPTDIKVLSGPHALLIDEAVRVARLWRFEPATVGGVPVEATFNLTVGFKLTN